MSARDALLSVIEDARTKYRDPVEGVDSDSLADLILASGWRPPRRTITTMDEVKAITCAAAIRTQHGDLMFRDDSEFDDWYHVGNEVSVGIYEGDLPATVLFEGEA